MIRTCFLLLIALLLSSQAMARNSIGDYSIQDAIMADAEKASLGHQVKFYFGSQPHGKVIKKFGEFRTNRKTNAFGKSDTQACQWVFMSALISLRDRAIAEGGNAVINIKSNYKNDLTSSNTTFRCGAGAFVAGTALVGEVVKLEN